MPLTGIQTRPLTARERLTDAALAAAVSLADLALFSTVPLSVLAGALTALYGVIGFVVLALRRRAPVVVLALMLMHSVGGALLSVADGLSYADYRPTLGVLVALYTVSAHRSLVRSIPALVVAFAVTATFAVIDALHTPLAPLDTPAGVVRGVLAGYALMHFAAWGIGRWVRASRENAAYLRELGELQRREAVAAERASIARDMHDTVTHAVTAVLLHAAGAKRVLDKRPDQAAVALEHIEEAGRRAMTELRSMLGVLRASSEPAVGRGGGDPAVNPAVDDGEAATDGGSQPQRVGPALAPAVDPHLASRTGLRLESATAAGRATSTTPRAADLSSVLNAESGSAATTGSSSAPGTGADSPSSADRAFAAGTTTGPLPGTGAGPARSTDVRAGLGQRIGADSRPASGEANPILGAGAGLSAEPRELRLDKVYEISRATGLTVVERVTGAPRLVPAAVAATAARVVQEALTNATKYAGPGATVVVGLRWAGAELEVDVSDNGAGSPLALVAGLSGGTGLAGLRERVATVGGSLTAGPREGGGFTVTARLPLSVPP